MPDWKRVKIEFPTVKLGEFIEPIKKTFADINDKENSTVYGVSNTEGITITGKEVSKNISKYIVLEENCFAYNPYRINVGSIGMNYKGFKGCVSPAYVVFKTKKELNPFFLQHYLKSDFGNHLINWYGNRGGVRNALRFDDLCNIDIPSLDINEQNKLLLRLDSYQKNLGLLGIESSSQSSYISLLRKSILQEAIEGKLTAEWRKNNIVCKGDPEYDAYALLEKIKEEKKRMITEGKIKMQKPLALIKAGEVPFTLPEGWVWTRLGDVIQYADNFDIQKKLRPNTLIKYIDIDCIDNNAHKIREIKEKKVSELSSRARRVLKKGYILYSTVRPYLENIAFVEHEVDNFIGSTGFNVFRTIHVYPNYIFNFLLSPYINNSYKEMMIGFNSPSITNNQFENTCISLPSLAEQRAIVERVNRLLSKVDELIQQVVERKELAEELMQSVLREAFGGNGRLSN